MGSPISPMEAIQIVSKAVALYKKIRDAPEVVEKVGKRMERLQSYLVGLKELLDDKSRHSLASLRPAQTMELNAVIKDIQTDSDKVYGILKRWDNNIGPFGLELRFKTVGQALFAVGSSPDKLESLSGEIEQHKNDLRDFLQLLGWFGFNNFITGGLQPPANAPQRPTSPLPQPNKKDYNIIFVDPSNVTCSSVAAAYIRLIQEWTTRTGGQFPINFSHSAGLNVRHNSNCVDFLENLSPPVVMKPGDQPPHWTAMAALFDNPLFNYPYKASVREHSLSLKSRGITDQVFSKYDFILVFTGRQYENMIRLKQAFLSKGRKSLIPKGKCRIVHLGSYLAKDGTPTEIVPPPKNKDGADSREGWNKVVANIKVSTKVFLKRETGWIQPTPGAKVS